MILPGLNPEISSYYFFPNLKNTIVRVKICSDKISGKILTGNDGLKKTEKEKHLHFDPERKNKNRCWFTD
jgi:hypothetical protein